MYMSSTELMIMFLRRTLVVWNVLKFLVSSEWMRLVSVIWAAVAVVAWVGFKPGLAGGTKAVPPSAAVKSGAAMTRARWPRAEPFSGIDVAFSTSLS